MVVAIADAMSPSHTLHTFAGSKRSVLRLSNAAGGNADSGGRFRSQWIAVRAVRTAIYERC